MAAMALSQRWPYRRRFLSAVVQVTPLTHRWSVVQDQNREAGQASGLRKRASSKPLVKWSILLHFHISSLHTCTSSTFIHHLARKVGKIATCYRMLQQLRYGLKKIPGNHTFCSLFIFPFHISIHQKKCCLHIDLYYSR